MKKLLIILLAMIITLSGCQKDTVENSQTKTNNMSAGILNLCEKTVAAYNDYINSKINLDTFTKLIDDYSSQAHDIRDINNSYDLEACHYIYEIEQKIDNNHSQREYLSLPINDLNTLLSGKSTNYLDYCGSYDSLLNATFYVPINYYKSSKSENNIHQWIHTFESKQIMVQVFNSILFDTSMMMEDLFKELLNMNGMQISSNIDIYFSRNCEYFYTAKGLFDNGMHVYAYSSYDNDGNVYIVYCISNDDSFNENEVHKILDTFHF